MKKGIFQSISILTLISCLCLGDEEGSVEVLETVTHEFDDRTITIKEARPQDLPLPIPPTVAPVSAQVPPVSLESVVVSHFITLAATVYENGTHLKWVDKETGQKLEAWSKVNWKHFNAYAVLPMGAEEQLTLIVLASNAASINQEIPQIPPGQDFVLIGEAAPCSSISCIGFAHAHYAKNCAEIVANYQARCLEQEARRAEALANPPQAKDIIIKARSLTDEEIQLLK